jgi:uncharacterized protein YjiS (DUF1127 family)
MTQIALKSHRKPSRGFSLSAVWHALSMQRQRRKLARLDARALDDIGLTREQAEAEAARYIWDAPEFWQK